MLLPDVDHSWNKPFVHLVTRRPKGCLFSQFLIVITPFFTDEIQRVLLSFQFSIVSDSATVGQQLLDLKYKNDWASVFGDAPAPSPGEGCAAPGQGRWMTRRQKALLGLCMVFGPWVSDRMYGIAWTLGISRARERPQASRKWEARILSALAFAL